MNFKLRKTRAAGVPSEELICTLQPKCKDSRQTLLYSCASLSDNQKVDQRNATSQIVDLCKRESSRKIMYCLRKGRQKMYCWTDKCFHHI